MIAIGPGAMRNASENRASLWRRRVLGELARMQVGKAEQHAVGVADLGSAALRRSL